MVTHELTAAPVRLAVVSDSHGASGMLRRAVELAGKIDALVFLGDGADDVRELLYDRPDLYCACVRGNNDFNCKFPDECLIKAGGALIYSAHGHTLGVRSDRLRLDYRAAELGADAALYGHTHTYRIERYSTLLINPGALSYPHPAGDPSFVVLTIKNGGIEPERVIVR